MVERVLAKDEMGVRFSLPAPIFVDNLGDKVDKGLTDKQIIGQIGEEKASEFLKKHGFTILDRNYRKKWGEIDVIAQKADNLHFFEVKTVSRRTLPSSNNDEYLAEENIHPWKMQRLSRAVQTYLLEKRVSDDLDWQIDGLTVYLEKGSNKVMKIEIIEDILV